MTENVSNTPVPVEIKNWTDVVAKPKTVSKTTAVTRIVDPTGVDGPTMTQICDYEPRRLRMLIEAIDSPVVLTLDPPVNSPDISLATAAPQGIHLGIGKPPYVFLGPDAAWINSLVAVTRVTIVKEYC